MDFEKLHREESGRILATLIGLLGDFDLAEEMLQEAYATALQKWPAGGTPTNARAWLISTARHKAIDRIRRDRPFETKSEEISRSAQTTVQPDAAVEDDDDMVSDDRLRLIFTCCHPALPIEARVALTLRTVCGVTPCVFDSGGDDGAAAGAGEEQDSGRRNSLPSAVAGRVARPARWRVAGHL